MVFVAFAIIPPNPAQGPAMSKLRPTSSLGELTSRLRPDDIDTTLQDPRRHTSSGYTRAKREIAFSTATTAATIAHDTVDGKA